MTSLRNTPDLRDGYLDAARTCILDVGWRRTTLTEVARRAGVSRMTIYRTWSDMPQLLGDLMTREWSQVVADVTRGDHPEGDLATTLAWDLATAVRALRENELFLRIVELDPQLLLPYLLSRRGRFQDALLAIVEGQVRAGQQAGAIRQANPTAIARSLVLATHGFVLSSQTMVDDSVSEADLDRELQQLITRALTP